MRSAPAKPATPSRTGDDVRLDPGHGLREQRLHLLFFELLLEAAELATRRRDVPDGNQRYPEEREVARRADDAVIGVSAAAPARVLDLAKWLIARAEAVDDHCALLCCVPVLTTFYVYTPSGMVVNDGNGACAPHQF